MADTLLEDVSMSVTMSDWIFLGLEKVSDKLTEQVKTQVLCQVNFFFSKIITFTKQLLEIQQSERPETVISCAVT